MFLFFPVPASRSGWPPVTTMLIGLNVVVFLFTWTSQLHQQNVITDDAVQSEARKLAAILSASDTLAPDDRHVLEIDQTQPQFPTLAVTDLFNRVQTSSLLTGPSAYAWSQEWPVYQSFEASQRLHPSSEETPIQKWGFRPRRAWWPGLVTHQFIHDGWLHLLGNMLFLWIVGIVLEPFLGGWLLLAYLIGGIAAAVAQAEWGPVADIILVGASGAISSLMGLALVATPSARITLFYGYWLSVMPRGGTLESPLWFCIPLWMLQQLFFFLMPVHDGVAAVGYAAHLGGFCFGLLLGTLWRGATKKVVATP